MLREVDRRSATGGETLLSMTRQRGLVRYSDTTEKVHSARTLVGYKICHPGEIVMNRMQAWSGMFHVAPEEGLVSPDYAVFSPLGDVSTVFLGHLLRSPRMVAKFHAESKGIGSGFLRLYGDRLGAIHAPLPPYSEQRATERFIVSFDRSVRRFIHNQRRLFEVLNEQKQAIINQAVTRGLNPNVPLKPSGIDWLGDIPEHWEVMPLKRAAKFRSGAGFPVSMQGQLGQELPFFRVSDMSLKGNELLMASTGSTVSCAQAKSLGATIFPEGSIIFPKVGGALLTNKRRVLTRPSCIDNNLMGCVVFGAARDFILLLLRLIDLGTFCNPGPVPAIGEEVLRSIKVPIPSIEEQQEIVSREQSETVSLTAQMRVAQREIDLIREYRTRLISDVVTGKVDVRHLAPAPDSEDLEQRAEALEPLEENIADGMMDDEEPVNEAD